MIDLRSSRREITGFSIGQMVVGSGGSRLNGLIVPSRPAPRIVNRTACIGF